MRVPLLLTLAACAPLAAACGDDPTVSANGDAVAVVATTPVVADLARNAGGDAVRVTSMLDARTDPHDYELRPRDVEALAGADLIVRSGGEIDEWVEEAIEGAGAEAPVVSLIDVVDPLVGGTLVPGEDDEGGAESSDEVDPHWWHDPANAARAVVALREALSRARPSDRAAFADHSEAYIARLDELAAAVEQCVSRIPRRARKLVTTHDALGYYARRFGLQVIGAVIPSRSTEGQPSAGAIAELVETIRRERVPAVFAEQSVSADVERAVAEQAGARIGAPLWTDTLGPEGSGAETYLAAQAANTRAIVEGLTSGRKTCSARS